jgi:hypothetical protein
MPIRRLQAMNLAIVEKDELLELYRRALDT